MYLFLQLFKSKYSETYICSSQNEKKTKLGDCTK